MLRPLTLGLGTAASHDDSLEEGSANGPSCNGGSNFLRVPLSPGELPHPASVGHHSLRCAPHCADGCITNGRRSALNQAGIGCGGWGIQVGPENFIKCTHLSRERSATLISRSNVRPFLGVNQYCRNAGVNQVEIAQGRRGSVGHTRLLRHGTSGECKGEYCDCLSVHGKEEYQEGGCLW